MLSTWHGRLMMQRGAFFIFILAAVGCESMNPVCPEYSGIVDVGSRWEYSYGLDEVSGTMWREVVELDGATGLVTIERGHDSFEDDEDTYDRVSGSYEYRCDGTGLWLLSWFNYDDEGAVEDVWDVHEPGYLEIPTHLSPGTTWTTDFHVTVSSSDGNEAEAFETHECTATSEESISVQAGEFDGIMVEWEPGWIEPPQQWFGLGTGLILWGTLDNANSMQLTSYRQ
jgi:hypothetical protein